MVPCGRGVRSTVSLVVHRSVMSRCAGTHPLRPPLPLDRLVPEELHTSRMRHPPRNEQWPSSGRGEHHVRPVRRPTRRAAVRQARPPGDKGPVRGVRRFRCGPGPCRTSPGRCGIGTRARRGGPQPEARATPGTHVPPVRGACAEEPRTHGTPYARSATPTTDPASRRPCRRAAYARHAVPPKRDADDRPRVSPAPLPKRTARARPPWPAGFRRTPHTHPASQHRQSDTRAPPDAPRRATARRTHAVRPPRDARAREPVPRAPPRSVTVRHRRPGRRAARVFPVRMSVRAPHQRGAPRSGRRPGPKDGTASAPDPTGTRAPPRGPGRRRRAS